MSFIKSVCYHSDVSFYRRDVWTQTNIINCDNEHTNVPKSFGNRK